MKVVLKISGESLGNKVNNISLDKVNYIAGLIQDLKNKGNLVSVIIGGGNNFRGRENPDMDKKTADTIGMLGTVVNALFLKDALLKLNEEVIISTPFTFPGLIDNYSKEEIYNTDKIIIYGGGIGKSGYSTDSVVMMATKNNDSELIIKLTNVDGVYDSDPKQNRNAKMYEDITYDEVINKKLGIMDMNAISECKDIGVKILVTNFNNKAGLLNFFDGEKIGTIIHN